MFADFKYALRQLRKTPGFTLTALLTLAIGIGVNAAVFSVMDAIVLRPLAVPKLDRVMTAAEDRGRGKFAYEWVSAANYEDWKEQSRSFASLAVFKRYSMSLTGAGDAAHVSAQRTSASFFDVLQIPAFLGRVYRADECQPGHDGEAVLSYSFWQTQFASDPAVVGRKIELDEREYTVIGVMPRGLVYPPATDMYLPWALTPAQLKDRGAHEYMVVGRLRSGVTAEQADAELRGIAARLQKLYPATNLGWSAKVEPLLDNISGSLTPLYTWLMLGGTLFVLLIVCANVANLQFARGIARRPEIAMRTALGAPRARLLRGLLAENLVLAFGGAAGGLLLAWLDLHLCLITMPDRVARYVAGWYTIHLNGRALAFTMVLAVAAGIVSGMAPALEAMRVNLAEQLRAGSRTGTGAANSHKLRNIFAGAQIALAVALVIGSALMCKGMWSTLRFADVYQPNHVLRFDVTLPVARYGKDEQKAEWYRASLEKLQALPGVRQSAVATMLPYGDGGWTDDFRIENRPLAPGKFDSAVRLTVSPGYFPAFAIPLLSGRGFNASDGATTDPVVVVSRTFAKRYFPGENPVGHRIQMNAASDSHEAWRRIVGVTGDAAYQWVDQTPQPAMYVDVMQQPPASMQYAIVTNGDGLALAPEVRKTLAAIDATLPLDAVETYEQDIHESTTGLMYAAAMLGVDAIIALLLAAIGIYGVMANLVAERRREIGVRLAMGARRDDVLRMILKRAAVLTGAGTLVGVAMAILMARGIASLLFGVEPNDPLVFSGIVVTIGVIALVSSWIPARQAAGVDPMEALREQ
ncbi:MAG TPA: ABC transporter permease [Acidobacteriaceae bacterium]|jgi:putative ABC transport system permease protein|nr:ABC transporter permease [Acidobacteriaceae bacterium]